MSCGVNGDLVSRAQPDLPRAPRAPGHLCGPERTAGPQELLAEGTPSPEKGRCPQAGVRPPSKSTRTRGSQQTLRGATAVTNESQVQRRHFRSANREQRARPREEAEVLGKGAPELSDGLLSPTDSEHVCFLSHPQR